MLHAIIPPATTDQAYTWSAQKGGEDMAEWDRKRPRRSQQVAKSERSSPVNWATGRAEDTGF